MKTDHSIVFYSWQSDLPNATNRGFIEEALKRAVKAIQNDDSIEAAPRVERDTVGIPGSPDISQTIFDKIDQADVFVCDVSIINTASYNERQDRPTPNPNVLIELGYALKQLGPRRVIMVFNTAYGGPELLPFDLRPRRVLSYVMPEKSDDRATERKRLEGALTESLRIILRELSTPLPGEIVEPKPLPEQICLAVESGQLTQAGLCKKYMKDLAERISVLAPKFPREETEPWDELLVQSLEESTKLVSEFIGLTYNLALIDTAEKAAMTLYEGFDHILNLYTYPPSSVPTYSNQYEHDFAKFLGHELFVVFFAALLQEGRWDWMVKFFEKDFYARVEYFGQPKSVPFTKLSQWVGLLERRNDRLKQHLKQSQLSIHADLLYERYTKGELATTLSVEHFMAADYFLYLRGESFSKEPSQWAEWMPWSTLYMKRLPDYFYKAERIGYANQLLDPLDILDISSLRIKLQEATKKWNGFWRLPRHIEPFDFDAIGSR